MAEIRVTPSELRAKADVLEGLNRQYRQEVEKMVGYEADLAGMWEGEAQKAFRDTFNRDREKMDRFAQNIDRYILALREDAQKYEDAEQKNASIASTRK